MFAPSKQFLHLLFSLWGDPFHSRLHPTENISLIPSCIWVSPCLNLQQSALNTVSWGLDPWWRRARLAPCLQHLPCGDTTPGYLVLDLYLHVGHWQRAPQTVLPVLLGMSVQERVVHLQRRHTVTPVLALKAAATLHMAGPWATGCTSVHTLARSKAIL